MSEAVENHFGEIVFLNQLLQCTVNGGSVSYTHLWAGSRCKDKNVRYVHLSMDEMEELAGKIAASS